MTKSEPNIKVCKIHIEPLAKRIVPVHQALLPSGPLPPSKSGAQRKTKYKCLSFELGYLTSNFPPVFIYDFSKAVPGVDVQMLVSPNRLRAILAG